MSQQEIERHQVLSRCLQGELTVKSASDLLDLSLRHTYRLKAELKQQGPEGLIHGNRGRASNRKMDEQERKEIVKLLKERYSDFKPGHACEKLEEHSYDWSSETIRQIMIKEGLWKVNPRKQIKYRSKRPRKEHYGELIQFDGSYHRWFERRAEQCCLLAAIDDATGTIVQAKFVDNENLNDIFGFWKKYLLNQGKPKAIYTDKLRMYHNNLVEEQSEDNYTQFQRAMNSLGINPIGANSPQAKGRIETLFGVLQDRLIKEMRLEGVCSKKEGNSFLEKFIPWYNEKYGKAPLQKDGFHRELSSKEQQLLPRFLSRQEQRTIHNDFTIRYHNNVYQLTKKQPVTVRKKRKIMVEERIDGSLWFRLKGKYLNYEQATPENRSLKESSWIIPANQKVEASS